MIIIANVICNNNLVFKMEDTYKVEEEEEKNKMQIL